MRHMVLAYMQGNVISLILYSPLFVHTNHKKLVLILTRHTRTLLGHTTVNWELEVFHHGPQALVNTSLHNFSSIYVGQFSLQINSFHACHGQNFGHKLCQVVFMSITCHTL